jgi:hypothetical protein
MIRFFLSKLEHSVLAPRNAPVLATMTPELQKLLARQECQVILIIF